jgi:Tol biopolymer transport system component
MKPAKLVLLTGLLCAALSAGYLASQAKDNKAEVALQAAIKTETVDGNLRGAIEQYKKIAAQPGAGRATVATALLRMGQCHEKLGNAEARTAYERLVREFADQAEIVAQARVRLAVLGAAADAGAVRERQLDWDCGIPAADGRTVLCSDCSKNCGLVVRDLVSGQERIVAAGNKEEGQFIEGGLISPDGKKVAYILLSTTRPQQIRVVGTDGSQDRLLSDQTYENDAFGTQGVRVDDWSPDSRQVLAWVNRKEQKDSQRLLLSVNDGAARVLNTFVGAESRSYGYGESSPRARFSPDGKHIAYEIEIASVQSKRIFAIPVQGGEPQLLVNHPSHNELVGWTPEGRLVFLSDRSGTRALWTLRVRDGKADGEPELVRRDIGSSTPVGIDRNGAYYYRLQTEGREVYRATLDPSSGAVVSGPLPVSLRYVGLSFWPAYSRDGRFLAYFSGPKEASNIHIRNLATGEERELKSSMSYTYYQSLAWYPDGSALLIRGMKVGDIVLGLHRLNVTTGEITTVLLAKGGGAYILWAGNPSFSPDGKYLYFRTYEADSTGVAASRISRLDLQTGGQEDVFLPARPAELRLFALSPDGTRIVFGARSGKLDYIGVVPVAGGESKVIYEYPAGEFMRGFLGLIWTADGKGVLYHRTGIGHASQNPADDLWLMSADGGSPRKLLSLTGVIMNLTVHPNGREIAFSTTESVWEFRVLENLFPPNRAAK